VNRNYPVKDYLYRGKGKEAFTGERLVTLQDCVVVLSRHRFFIRSRHGLDLVDCYMGALVCFSHNFIHIILCYLS